MNETLSLIDHHRTIRAFRDEAMPAEHLQLIIDAARKAPTDATAQMYSFIRITNPDLRKRMAELAGGQAHIVKASEFFVVCADVHRIARMLEHRGEKMGNWPRVAIHFAVADATLAAQNMVIAAESLGYGICYIGGILNGIDVIAHELKLPTGVLPAFGLCIGVPDEHPNRRPRVPEHLVVMENEYIEPSADDIDAAYKSMAPITRAGDWFVILQRYFATGGVMEQRDVLYRATLQKQGLSDPT